MGKEAVSITIESLTERLRPDSDLPSDAAEYDRQLEECTQSLAATVTDYTFVNGRRYHAFKRGAYPFPNDEREKERIDLTHHVFYLASGNKLFSAPVERPERILDLGTGTGIWAIDVAEKFPDAQVLGNDLSPIQPDWVPPNLHFEVDDIEADWVFGEQFDLVHCRALSSAIRDWPKLVRQAFEFTKPGGWVEFVDYDSTLRSPDGTIPPDSPLAEVNRLFDICVRQSGQEGSPGPRQERWLREAGFDDVHVKRLPMPIGAWPADTHLKEIGALQYFALVEHIDSFITLLFQRHLGHSREQCEAMAALMRKQLADPNTHAFFDLYITYARKPELLIQ